MKQFLKRWAARGVLTTGYLLATCIAIAIVVGMAYVMWVPVEHLYLYGFVKPQVSYHVQFVFGMLLWAVLSIVGTAAFIGGHDELMVLAKRVSKPKKKKKPKKPLVF